MQQRQEAIIQVILIFNYTLKKSPDETLLTELLGPLGERNFLTSLGPLGKSIFLTCEVWIFLAPKKSSDDPVL